MILLCGSVCGILLTWILGSYLNLWWFFRVNWKYAGLKSWVRRARWIWKHQWCICKIILVDLQGWEFCHRLKNFVAFSVTRKNCLGWNRKLSRVTDYMIMVEMQILSTGPLFEGVDIDECTVGQCLIFY